MNTEKKIMNPHTFNVEKTELSIMPPNEKKAAFFVVFCPEAGSALDCVFGEL